MCIYCILVVDKVALIVSQKLSLWAIGFSVEGWLCRYYHNYCEKFSDNLGFWQDKCIMIFNCPGMVISPFSIMNGHVFQSANEHKAIDSRPTPSDLVTKQHLGICVKHLSGQPKP